MSVVGGVFLVFVVCLILGAPIAVALLFSALMPDLMNPAWTADAGYAFRTIVTSMDSFVFLAIPMFILSGNLMAKGGISNRLFTFFSYFVGSKRAGLPCAVILSCLFYGAISGSGPATVAAVGAMTIPFLVNLGYEKSFAVSLVAVAGGLGVIIPPSIPFVMYGLSANESVAKLFVAGILPGFLIGVCLMIAAGIMCRREGGVDELKLKATHQQLRARGFLSVLKESALALICPIIVLGGIYTGIATPTEAATISVFYALIVSCFVYKSMKLKDVWHAVEETVNSMVAMIFVAACANVFGKILSLLQVPQMVATLLTTAFNSKVVIFLVINAFLLVVGMLMDAVSAILITTPILLPVCTQLGMSPIHLGIMMTVNLAIGFVTPPVGVNLFVASNMSDVPVATIAKNAVPFIIFFIIALLIITFVPGVSMLLV